MLRTAALLVAVLLTSLTLTACGTGASLGKIRSGATNSSSGSKSDCAACKKMCEVGGSAENNESGVEACKKDCDKSCK